MPESRKYKRLEDFLKTEVTITMRYDEIEEVLGFKLPPSAYEHAAWWDNNTHSHTQMWSWLNAGWSVEEIVLGKRITFKKLK